MDKKNFVESVMDFYNAVKLMLLTSSTLYTTAQKTNDYLANLEKAISSHQKLEQMGLEFMVQLADEPFEGYETTEKILQRSMNLLETTSWQLKWCMNGDSTIVQKRAGW